jgi:hypothetical protein
VAVLDIHISLLAVAAGWPTLVTLFRSASSSVHNFQLFGQPLPFAPQTCLDLAGLACGATAGGFLVPPFEGPYRWKAIRVASHDLEHREIRYKAKWGGVEE